MNFTRMLTDDQYFLDHLGTPSASPDFNDQVIISSDNSFDEDDQYDKSDDEIDISSRAPVPEFATLSEIDRELVNSWETWTSLNKFTPGSEFCVGHDFPNKVELKNVVKAYSIMRNQSFKVQQSKADVVTLVCKRNPLYSEVFTITAYNGPHSSTCVGTTIPRDHIHLDSEFSSFHIRELVQADTSIKISVIREVMKERFKFDISYKKAWLAKQRAIAHIFGDWEKSYEDLPHFMQAMKEANPGTIVHFANQRTSDPQLEIFQRVFWAFGPSIEGFKHCRPIITIDGTHLYGKYQGTLLIAMGVDANNQLFPLPFAIVERENGRSWPWFMACVKGFVTQREGLCIISDRHLGIMKAMKEPNSGWQEPHAHHRLCMRHLASNLNTKFKNVAVKKHVRVDCTTTPGKEI